MNFLPMASIATVKAGQATTMERLVEQQRQEMQWQEMQWHPMQAPNAAAYGSWWEAPNAAAHGSWWDSTSSWSEWQPLDSSIGSHSSFTTTSKINTDVSLGNLKNEWPKSLKT